jgi:hypothetical protein
VPRGPGPGAEARGQRPPGGAGPGSHVLMGRMSTACASVLNES